MRTTPYLQDPDVTLGAAQMSANEKLKKIHEECGWPPYDRKVGEALLLVVEAAEEIAPLKMHARLEAALSALEEALS